MPAHYVGSFSGQVLDSWAMALRTIMDLAAGRDECTWEAPLHPDEPGYDQPPAERLRRLYMSMEKSLRRAGRNDAN